MSPLARYYGTLAICAAGFVAMVFFTNAFSDKPGLQVDTRVFLVVFVSVFVLLIYNTFGIGCPKCGARLGLMSNWGGLRHGLPGRYCTECRADLSDRS